MLVAFKQPVLCERRVEGSRRERGWFEGMKRQRGCDPCKSEMKMDKLKGDISSKSLKELTFKEKPYPKNNEKVMIFSFPLILLREA